jgi:HPt (histidine-containing phosphotransfer) domain-containing protein
MHMKEQEQTAVNFDYLLELSGGDPRYQEQVMSIFLENMQQGLKNLEALVREEKDWDAVHRQAHALKSGLGVISIPGMLVDLQEMEVQAQQDDKGGIPAALGRLLEAFRKAEPVLNERIKAFRAG